MEAPEYSIYAKPASIEETRRKLSRIDWFIQEVSYEVKILDRAIAVEEKKSGITDPNHYAYPSYAKAASLRRDNLLSTIEELKHHASREKMAA
jgi:flagellar protein FliJ